MQTLFLRTEVVKNEDGTKRVMYHKYGSPSNKRTVRSLKPFAKPSKRMSLIGRPSNDNVSNIYAVSLQSNSFINN